MSSWQPKTAVITGGASGIGLALAERLIASGTKVIIADLAGETLHKAGDQTGALVCGCDVSKTEEVSALADFAYSQFDQVDLVLNNAGISGPHGKMWDIDPADARAHFDVNFWGIWNVCQAFAPRLAAAPAPSAIYNTGSENSFFCAVPQSATYIAAKHAVLGLTESMREDLPDHVHIGLIVPGWVFTSIGDPRMMRHGMDAGEYAEIVMPQILARERFVVSHYSNLEAIRERNDALYEAYETSSSRAHGYEAFDVRKTIAKLRGG